MLRAKLLLIARFFRVFSSMLERRPRRIYQYPNKRSSEDYCERSCCEQQRPPNPFKHLPHFVGLPRPQKIKISFRQKPAILDHLKPYKGKMSITEISFRERVRQVCEALTHSEESAQAPLQYQGARAYAGPVILRGPQIKDKAHTQHLDNRPRTVGRSKFVRLLPPDTFESLTLRFL